MKKAILMVGVFSILFPLVAFAQGPGSGAQWINISGNLKKAQAPMVYPSNIYIDRGTQVLLANGSDTPVKVKFGSGADCKEVGQAQLLNYQWAMLGCMVTPVMQPKTVLEMFPNEPGPFPWEIEFVGTDKKLSGVLKIF